MLQLAEYVGDDFEDGFEQLCFAGKYDDVIERRITEYCDEMGLDYDVFETYLSLGYVERIKRDMEFNKRLDIIWPGRVRRVWSKDGDLFK